MISQQTHALHSHSQHSNMKIKNKYDNNLLFSFVKQLSSANTKQTLLLQWLCEGHRFALAAQSCAARVKHV